MSWLIKTGSRREVPRESQREEGLAYTPFLVTLVQIPSTTYSFLSNAKSPPDYRDRNRTRALPSVDQQALLSPFTSLDKLSLVHPCGQGKCPIPPHYMLLLSLSVQIPCGHLHGTETEFTPSTGRNTRKPIEKTYRSSPSSMVKVTPKT